RTNPTSQLRNFEISDWTVAGRIVQFAISDFGFEIMGLLPRDLEIPFHVVVAPGPDDRAICTSRDFRCGHRRRSAPSAPRRSSRRPRSGQSSLWARAMLFESEW